MARELGMNPKKLGKIDNHDQEPWKMPLRQFIEHLYFKRFGKERPDTVLSIEDKIRKDEEKRRLRREAKLEARKMGSVPMMSQRSHGGNRDFTSLDEMIEDITVDTYGDDEKFWAFLQAFADHIELPVDGFVIGEPVSVIEIDYDGNERRGITAKCKREDGSEHVIAIYEVVFPEKSKASRYIAAYRRWLNLDPFPTEAQAPSRSKRQHKATADDLDLSRPVELVALSVKQRAARCRLLGSDRVITLRASGLWDVVPGMIVTIKPHKQWRYSGHPYLSGEIQTTRLDVAELNLIPLGLEDKGIWDPETHYWGEEDEPIEQWAKPIIAYGPRPKFEMEQVLPGVNPDDPFDDPFSDPIIRSNDLKDAGKRAEAEEILMELCQTDLRCLDAHSHLGNLAFDHRPQDAIRHYEVGLRIGELSLSPDFDGVLPWGHIDNRPFLRNMHGYGLCLWRLGRFDLAEHIFDRMLWLNPSDNQGIRFLIDDVRERIAWEDRVNE
jgi:tetratricopeptide (TPR) repeat protein